MTEKKAYETFQELLDATSDENPLKITVWGPDSRWSRVRAVEIHGVGFTQVSRRRFRGWNYGGAIDVIAEYIVLKYDLRPEDIRKFPLDIEWVEETWTQAHQS